MSTDTPPQPTLSPNDGQLPSWASELLKRPLVEIRRGISFGYDAPKEESSVIALTVCSGKYVDIRFPTSATQQYIGIKPSEVFKGYATAGLSVVHMPTGTATCQPYDCTAHIKWQHPIDSTREFATDGADMYLLSNGDVMEVGTMVHDGQVKMFKEYWLAAKLKSKDPPYFVVEISSETNEGATGKGMVIRIDNYCQGILQTDTGFWVERWQTLDDGRWAMDPRSTTTTAQDGVLPCQWLISERRKVGDSIILDGRTWQVVETHETGN